jgi:AraC-like DNA-binding protein
MYLEHRPLLFGDIKVVGVNDYDMFADYLSHNLEKIKDFDYIGKKSSFFAKRCFVNINGLHVISDAVSTNAGRCYCQDKNRVSLIINVDTAMVIGYDKKEVSVQANSNAFIISNHEYIYRVNDNLTCCFIIFEVDKLIQIASGMLGRECSNLDFRLDNPRELSLNYFDINFDLMFRQLYNTLDIYLDNQELLGHLRIDEQFYRTIAMLIRPDLFFENREMKTASSDVIVKIENYVESYPYEKITLSDLESITGLGARGIQKLFKKYKNMTPLAYIRKCRLHLARKLLIARPHDTITSIAMEVGFTSASLFSKYYKNEFGESPREYGKVI